ncbi:MAG: CAP domain-containing protein [Solirubrobacteraceae bacterium]
MSDSDTAVLCLVKARAWTAARRVATLVAMLVASLSFASVAAAHIPRCAGAHSSLARSPRVQLQRAVVCLINEQRQSRGLPRLRENPRLNRSAQGWTNVMVTHRDFSHGADFAARISAAGFDWSNVGENIATGYATPTAVVKAWMASKGHCQNILNPVYRYVGTGVSDSSISGYSTLAGTWTQDFGLLMGQHPPSGTWGPAEGCPYN